MHPDKRTWYVCSYDFIIETNQIDKDKIKNKLMENQRNLQKEKTIIDKNLQSEFRSASLDFGLNYHFSKRKWKYSYTFCHFYSEKSSKRAK